MKEAGMLVVSLISDFNLSEGVLGKRPFRVALEETLKN